MATCAIAGVLPPSSAPAVPIVITLTGLPLRFTLCGLCAPLPDVQPAAASRAAVIRATAVVDHLRRLILLIVHPASCQATDANNPSDPGPTVKKCMHPAFLRQRRPPPALPRRRWPAGSVPVPAAVGSVRRCLEPSADTHYNPADTLTAHRTRHGCCRLHTLH